MFVEMLVYAAVIGWLSVVRYPFVLVGYGAGELTITWPAAFVGATNVKFVDIGAGVVTVHGVVPCHTTLLHVGVAHGAGVLTVQGDVP